MKYSISAAEWQVMRVLWAHPGSTSQQVSSALQEGFDWQPTTVKTLLGRLRKKDYLRMVKETSKCHYYPLISEEEHLQGQVDLLLAATCSTKHADLVAYLFQIGTFSAHQLQDLSDMLAHQLRTAPTTIVCHCLAGQCTCGHHQTGERT